MNKISYWICKIVTTFLVPLMTVIVFTQVVMRYVFSSPFPWAEELSRYILIWISCFGAAVGVREGVHVSILTLNKRLKGWIKFFVTLAIHFLEIGFFTITTISGIFLSLGMWNVRSSAMRIHMTLPYIAVPISFLFMIIFSFESLIRDIKKYLFNK